MSSSNPVTGITKFKNLYAQQHNNAFGVFEQFLSAVKPARILEIGTAGGGFTLFLREKLNELGLKDSMIISFDINDAEQYDKVLRPLNNLDIYILNIFDATYKNIVYAEMIRSYIGQDGLTLVLCDGGNKISEFRILSGLLKPGDIIMAHDYIDTIENFNDNFRDKIWNWREIGYEHISDVCKENNLAPFFKEDMAKVVWACYRKNS